MSRRPMDQIIIALNCHDPLGLLSILKILLVVEVGSDEAWNPRLEPLQQWVGRLQNAIL